MRAGTVFLALVFFLSAACAEAPRAEMAAFSAERAMQHVRAQVAFGPRPPGSEALEKCRQYLIRELRSYGYQIEQDAFDAEYPLRNQAHGQRDCPER